MFSVDYGTIYQILRQFMYTGIFRAKVEASRIQREEGYVELEVKEGVICICYFINMQAQVSRWDEWEARLSQFGVLNWEIVQQHLSETFSHTSSPLDQKSSEKKEAREILYQVISLSPSQLRWLPMLHRQVYSLVNGKRRVSDIVLILHKSEQEIFLVITDLSHKGYIKSR